MRPSNTIIISAASATTTQNSLILDAAFIVSASFQINSSNSGNAGTLQIQASNDLVNTLASGVPNTGQPAVVNWANLAASGTVVGGASTMVSVPQSSYAGYRWLRAVWTPSSGAGTITVNSFTIGVN